jgi:multidrug resistance efflux pump
MECAVRIGEEFVKAGKLVKPTAHTKIRIAGPMSMPDQTNQQDQEKQDQDKQDSKAAPAKDPVRKWTFIVLGLCIVLTALYLVADRQTPFTSQARVHAFVVPIAPQVSGNVISVEVKNNDQVAAGQVLIRIDPTDYELAVASAEATLQVVKQSIDAGFAGVEAAEASVEAAKASKWRSETDAVRMRRIRDEDPGAISQRRIDSAEASLAAATARVAAATASLESARSAVGEIGENNADIQNAQAALDKARVDLQRTVLVAPRDGVVNDMRIDHGNFAAAGAALMTFIATHEVWVRADLTENNLGNVKAGDRVEMTFDVQPGKIYKGKIREIGFGVQVDSNALGTLPTIDNQRNWLRDAQRFPVLIDVETNKDSQQMGLRVGSQVSVIVYTGNNWLMNFLGRIYIRGIAVLSYAY